MGVRQAELRDIPDICYIIRKLAEKYDTLRFDQPKVTQELKDAISSASHFAAVSTFRGDIKGALIAYVFSSAWFERQTATILLFHTEVPDDWELLLTNFLSWASQRRTIKITEIHQELPVKEFLDKLLVRKGFEQIGVIYKKLRGQ